MDAPAIQFANFDGGGRWVFHEDEAHVSVAAGLALEVDTPGAALHAAMAGFGFWQTSALEVDQDLREGGLDELLPSFVANRPVHLLFPAGRRRPRRVDNLAQWLAERVMDRL